MAVTIDALFRQYTTLADTVRVQAQASANNTAMIFADRETSYAEVELTHANLLHLLPIALTDWGNWCETDVSMAAMPLFHVARC